MTICGKQKKMSYNVNFLSDINCLPNRHYMLMYDWGLLYNIGVEREGSDGGGGAGVAASLNIIYKQLWRSDSKYLEYCTGCNGYVIYVFVFVNDLITRVARFNLINNFICESYM